MQVGVGGVSEWLSREVWAVAAEYYYIELVHVDESLVHTIVKSDLIKPTPIRAAILSAFRISCGLGMAKMPSSTWVRIPVACGLNQKDG